MLSDNPGAVDLFAASKSKDFGRRIYRKVACVEEFFDIIYNVHMELGGRSGMHAGQKRTYRIVSVAYESQSLLLALSLALASVLALRQTFTLYLH